MANGPNCPKIDPHLAARADRNSIAQLRLEIWVAPRIKHTQLPSPIERKRFISFFYDALPYTLVLYNQRSIADLHTVYVYYM